MLTVTKSTALECGYTHHGVAFGVPVWITDHPGNRFRLVPKFIPLVLWISFADLALHAVCWSLPGLTIECKIRKLRRI